MTSKQRAYLRSLANSIDPIFQIGKAGLSENLLKQLNFKSNNQLKDVLESSGEDVKALGNEIADSINAICVQTMGNKITLYRARKKNPIILLD